MTEQSSESQRRKEDAPSVSFITNWWSHHVVQPVWICVSVVSLFIGIVAVSHSLGGSQLWMNFAWLFIIVAMEGILTTMWLNQPAHQNIDRLIYRIAELLVIILLARLFTWTVSDTWPQLRWLRNYLLTPAALIGDPFFLLGALLAVLAWLRSISLSQLFAQLAIDQAEAGYYALPAGNREPGNRPLPVDRGQLVVTFFHQWIAGAFILIICTAVTTFDLSDLAVNDFQNTTQRLALQPEILSALLVYFLSGFFLLGQARLAAMNSRWLIGGTAKGSRVERSWHRSNLWLILVVALVAAFLPLGSTLGASHILEAIAGIFFILFNAIIGLLLALLSLLIPRKAGTTASESVRNLPQSLPSSLPPAEPNQFLAMLFSSLFWAIAIFVTIAAIGFFLRDRGVPVNIRLFKRLWQNLLIWLRSLWQDFSSQTDSIRQAVRRRKKREQRIELKPTMPRWRLIRINALSPRDQLRYFYLSTVRRAGEQGVKRQECETPLEYAQDLKDSWPESEIEVGTLTDAFLKARYSPSAIETAEANAVRHTWKQIKSLLRRHRRSQSAAMERDEPRSSTVRD